jgi:beta-phosphoglucomutase-like phosphatase (HAD superfamily)
LLSKNNDWQAISVMEKAIIFDFDGTLVDTMPIHYEAYRQVFSAVKIDLTRNDFFDNIGGKASETIPKFLRGRSCSLTPQEIHSKKKDIVSNLLQTVHIPVLETAKLLPFFHGVIKMALASSGSRPGIDVVLKRLDWNRYFEVIVTGEDVSNGKPSPDIFLLAAKKLGVSPVECIVFEDTDDGLVAGRNAKMQVFDVRATICATSR